MIEVKSEYPYNDNNGLIKHYAEDESGVKYHIIQVETGVKYGEAIDVYPCRYTYKATDEAIPQEEEEETSEGDVIETL